jgi:heme/copper-type cytochrome/quinol oxidase subunit 3
MTDVSIPHVHTDAQEEARSIDNQKFAMWLYLASEVVIFSVFIGMYAVFRLRSPESVHAVHEEVGFNGVLLVTFNTFLLLMSSWAMVMGLREIQHNNVGDIRKPWNGGLVGWLFATAVLGTIFIFFQYVEYGQLAQHGVTIDASDFGMRFYVPTFFHGFHVFAGVVWCAEVIRRALNGRYSARNYVGVEVFGLYWHFVDVVWIILFTLIYLV